MPHRHLRPITSFTLACLLCATGYASAAIRQSPPGTPTSNNSSPTISRAHPGFAVHAGKHEFDGQLPDCSEAGLQKEIKRLHAERDKAAAFKDADLDDRQRFERDYLLSQIDGDLFWLEVADQPHTAPFWYADALDPDVYISREYAPLETRIKSYTKFARNVPRALEQVKANLKLPLAKTSIKIAHRTIGGLADFFAKDVPKIFGPSKTRSRKPISKPPTTPPSRRSANSTAGSRNKKRRPPASSPSAPRSSA